jgi:hypothetical protein
MKSMIVLLYGLTSCLAASLVFSAELLIGKLVLPVLGGTPAVWNTCLMFYQLMLLCGYLLAHGLEGYKRRDQDRVRVPSLVILAALVAAGYAMQPIALPSGSLDTALFANRPALALLQFLFAKAAVPLVFISATTPLVQAWFTMTGHPRARDPYFLYAASNIGSLLALVAYPFLIEPNLSLSVQSGVWRAGFLILAVLVFVCGAAVSLFSRSHFTGSSAVPFDEHAIPEPGETDAHSNSPLTPARVLKWLLLVFIPSSWLMGVTTYLTTDLAPIPLFWIIPLALYLVSFIVAFARKAEGIIRRAAGVFPYVVVPLLLVMSAGFVQLFWIPLHLLAFLCGSLACHGTLTRSRPAARHATLFYVIMAAGGLLGGIFNALVAPLIFTRVVEYPLAVTLACLVAPDLGSMGVGRGLKAWLSNLSLPLVVFLLTAILVTNQAGLVDSAVGVLAVIIAAGLGMLACVTAGQRPIRFALTVGSVFAASGLTQAASGRLLYIDRNFFGVVRVTLDPERNAHRLFHGSTLHGQQSLDPVLRKVPSTFFTRSGPIGQVFAAIGPRLEAQGTHVAIIGLGVGTLASYARPGQHWIFYEIDEAVERIARDPRFFTYLNDSDAGSIEISLGDARLRLRDAPDHRYQLIVLDAFSSDAVPVHLLSREAITMYRSKLTQGGLLVFNLTNRYLDLDAIMGRQAADLGLICRVCYDLNVSEEEKHVGKQPSIWAVLAESEGDLSLLDSDRRWQPPVPRAGTRAWTDDYSDVASYLLMTPGQLWGRELELRPPAVVGKKRERR